MWRNGTAIHICERERRLIDENAWHDARRLCQPLRRPVAPHRPGPARLTRRDRAWDAAPAARFPDAWSPRLRLSELPSACHGSVPRRSAQQSARLRSSALARPPGSERVSSLRKPRAPLARLPMVRGRFRPGSGRIARRSQSLCSGPVQDVPLQVEVRDPLSVLRLGSE